MSDDRLKPGGALSGRLFKGFLQRLADAREPDIGERIGPWQIVSELGRGGSGVVFLAERADGAFSQQVALKWLRGDRPVPGGRKVLARERELLASLDHPHIARLIDGGETEDGMLWFAMDYAAGQTIDRHCTELTLPERIDLMQTICRAVHHAHRRGLIHGDIKPSNVQIDGRGRPRLIDFGISRIKGRGPGSSYGLTPDYASPEQIAGEPLTTASDIWQLGHLLMDLCGDEPVPGDLRAIIDRAKVARPEDRYASAEAMAADLQAWLEHRPVAAHAGGPAYRLARWVRRNRALSVVSVLALVVMFGGGVWMTWQLAAERDTAQVEAARTEAALADTEAALARAEALRDFLVDLFQATRPTGPRDQLPSTEEILARGAERALDPDAAPAIERFGMLTTIGQVYRAQNLHDEARPLLEAAVALVDTEPSLQPQDQARALKLKAHLLISAGDSLDQAEALLVAAEARLESVDGGWDLLAQTRILRTWVERHRGNHDQALALVEPLYQRLHRQGRLSGSTSGALLDALAGLHAAAGDRDRAAQFTTEAIEAYRQAQGKDAQGYVVILANSVGLERAMGRFDEAMARAREAIELYDRIYPEPVDYRASVRIGLARTLLAVGDIEKAFAELRTAGAEYAEFMGTELSEWPLYFSQRGSFQARLGRHEAAVSDVARARALVEKQGGFDPRLVSSIEALHAWTSCLEGDAVAGRAILESMAQPETLHGRPRNRALLHEARAACFQAGGEPEVALSEIESALALQAAPGDVLESAGRRLLKAQILSALDRPDEAEQVLDDARQRFDRLGLDRHPRRMALVEAGAELPNP
ncbi:MAG: hypothetical protein EA419_03670 [Wenzhouxiangella sp.]|nr:MAG: hypothetical protein EA419_03670 [Wenzhouxiangella sp.]